MLDQHETLWRVTILLACLQLILSIFFFNPPWILIVITSTFAFKMTFALVDLHSLDSGYKLQGRPFSRLVLPVNTSSSGMSQWIKEEWSESANYPHTRHPMRLDVRLSAWTLELETASNRSIMHCLLPTLANHFCFKWYCCSLNALNFAAMNGFE